MSALGIIPARYASTRFPGKALANIAGRPMVQHVVLAARRAKLLRDVWVATDNEGIAEAARAINAPVVMTSPEHRSGGDRCAEAAHGVADEIIVNIQGDEPLLQAFVIDAVVQSLQKNAAAHMATAMHAAGAEAAADPNRVKVVCDSQGRALYFSRSPLPYLRPNGAAEGTARCWQHIGLYAYRRDFLRRYVQLESTPLERAEALEQLRVLEHGYAIYCAAVEGWHSIPVDTPEDAARVNAIINARA